MRAESTPVPPPSSSSPRTSSLQIVQTRRTVGGAKKAMNALLSELPARVENIGGWSPIQTRRQRVKHSLQDLDIVLQEFQDEVAAYRVSLHKEQNAIAPIHQLPVELLAVIFSESLRRDREAKLSEWDDRTHRVMELSTVATRWWDVLKSNPSFWTTIEFDRSAVAWALRQSKDMPINIKGVTWLTCTEPLAEFLALIVPHARRWRSLRWEESRGSAALSLLLKVSPTPKLELLDVDHRQSDDGMHVQCVLPAELRELRLRNVSIPWRSQNHLPSLRRFCLARLTVRDTSAALVAFLHSCPCLEEIEFIVVGLSEAQVLLPIPPLQQPASSHQILNFSNLKTLVFKEVAEVLFVELLPLIRAESLVYLVVDFNLKNNNFQSEPVLQALASKAGGENLLRRVYKNATGLAGELRVVVAVPCLVLDSRQDLGGDRKRGVRIRIPGYGWINRLDEVFDSLSLDHLPTHIPIRFDLYHRSREDDDDTDVVDLRFLHRLPGIEKLYVGHRNDLVYVFNYLSELEDDEQWPCPNLTELHINVGRAVKDRGGEIVKALDRVSLRRPNVEIYGHGDKYIGPTRYHRDLTTFLGMDLKSPGL